jgi:hypothetical protein
MQAFFADHWMLFDYQPDALPPNFWSLPGAAELSDDSPNGSLDARYWQGVQQEAMRWEQRARELQARVIDAERLLRPSEIAEPVARLADVTASLTLFERGPRARWTAFAPEHMAKAVRAAAQRVASAIPRPAVVRDAGDDVQVVEARSKGLRGKRSSFIVEPHTTYASWQGPWRHCDRCHRRWTREGIAAHCSECTYIPSLELLKYY